MRAGFLGGLQVTSGGFALPFGRAAVGGDVAETLRHRVFVDFGGALVCGAGLVMAMDRALMRCLVTLLPALGVLGGTLRVFLRDGLAGGQLFPPEQQLLGALAGLVAR